MRAAAEKRKLSKIGDRLYPPPFGDVTADIRINREEIFGPVLSVLKFKTAEQAIEIANGTDYGLAAVIFTDNLSTAIWCSERLDAGQAHVNKWDVGGYCQVN
ncbi:MAG: aldehyde dehydrogenase family protein [Gammaproteobacteria bacterium]|nr:aldehyde dehydrogenase family protein [Gammaproteobacteria bacterium]